MILSRAPFRVTLGGGGTDLPAYYDKHGGFVLAMGLDKHMYLAVNPSMVDRHVRVLYTKTETVNHPDELRHELAREALKLHGVHSSIEIASIADLPSGTGLGSSSCYLVGLLHALRAHLRQFCSLEHLAEEAWRLEHQLGGPVGHHNSYSAVFGGMTVMEFAPNGGVKVRPARVKPSTLPDFIANTHLYFTGVRGGDPGILRDRVEALRAGGESPAHQAVQTNLHAIKDIGYAILEALETENYDDFGLLMDRHWQAKKSMSSKVNLPGLDELYQEVKDRFGVLGGKVSGVGGGGCILVYAPSKHRELTDFMQRRGLQRLHYGIDFEGVKVVSDISAPHQQQRLVE
ncbi:MAG: galactokinase [Planctomycetota bacterium]